jgi:hypothetical protein
MPDVHSALRRGLAMTIMLVGIAALLFTAVYPQTMDIRLANPEAAVNASVPRTAPGGRIVIAQGEVQIPSDAQLERMEERAITTPPLDVRGAPGRGLSEGAGIRQMDERARRIDERLMGGDAICADCE